VLAGGTVASATREMCVGCMCHCCPQPGWSQCGHRDLAVASSTVEAVGFTCPSAGQRGSLPPSVLPLPGPCHTCFGGVGCSHPSVVGLFCRRRW